MSDWIPKNMKITKSTVYGLLSVALFLLGFYLILGSIEIFGVSESKDPQLAVKIGIFSLILIPVFLILRYLEDRKSKT